ncbi:hypothetical protein PSTG_15849 [Puccinia striiformis f. sp. tritici PST-78]|uniref:Uncharacterized protein n=1 Tax=Puccinia striiformis f. sp. tritici PST-78 TaxID=1165861 RepID=A0A0L0UUH8_9BASI|nr:hypothetical protein PSTG_15849 [Puccinia striiformis f. sp. tritici PST-78]
MILFLLTEAKSIGTLDRGTPDKIRKSNLSILNRISTTQVQSPISETNNTASNSKLSERIQ